MGKYEKLFSPGVIGELELENRIVMPAMEPGLANADGMLDGEAAAAYYGLRAKGGCGLIITGNVAISPNGRAAAIQPGLWSDDQVAPFRTMVEAVHRSGGRVFIQLCHAGREVHPLLGWEAVAPSAIRCPVLRTLPRALEIEEIKTLVTAFADAAERSVSAGADGIELHGAHGYLICQFLSPTTNQREDQYGGSLMNRTRFAIEVIEAVRDRVGKTLPLSFRLSADELVDGGINLSQAREMAGMFEEAGVSVINVSACNYESAFYNLPNYYLEEGCFIALAKAVRTHVDIPVIAVGRIRTPERAEEVLTSDSADFVALGRSLIADPYLPSKARLDRSDEIRPCLSCNRCIDSLSFGPIACTVNPWLQNEQWPCPKPKADKGQAFVAGSGPAGLTAACGLAREGFRVTVYEREEKAGGKLNLASLPPRKDLLAEYQRWLLGELKRLEIELRCSEPLSAAMILEMKPERVIIATGAAPSKPPFPVKENAPVFSVRDALLAPERLGSNVAIIGAGGEGAELADFLSEGEVKVTLIEAKRKVALDILPSLRFFLLQRLEEKGVELVTRFKVSEVGPGYVAGIRGKRAEDRLESFSSVVVAIGYRPLNNVSDELESEGVEHRVVGDAREPKSILEAVRDAARAAKTPATEH